jgi:hypothetical protein
MMRPDTLDKIRALLVSGGYVAFIGSLPGQSTTDGVDQRVTDAAQTLLAEFPDQTRRVARVDQVDGVDEVDSADGLDGLVDWMAARVPPAVRWNGPDSVRLMWRQEAEREILLVANPGAAAAAGDLMLPRGGAVSIWDPESGTVDRGNNTARIRFAKARVGSIPFRMEVAAARCRHGTSLRIRRGIV